MINKLAMVTSVGKIEFIERPLPQIGENQVLIEIKASAICGSDLHIFKDRHPAVPLPVAIGHEFAGIVIEIGKRVADIQVGDRVTVEPVIACGECHACITGNYGYCENISFTYRNGDGAFAQYFVAERQFVYKLPEHMSYREGSLIEPLAVATHAVRRAKVALGETVIILGAGAIGILIASLCRSCGATEVAVVDLSGTRLKKALEMGATRAINPSKDDFYREVARLTGSSGADKTFECVGLEETLIQSMMALKKGGLATVVGIFEEPMARIPATRFITHEIKIQGSQGYCWDFPVAISMTKAIDLKRLITHIFPLDELEEAMKMAINPSSNAIKVIVEP